MNLLWLLLTHFLTLFLLNLCHTFCWVTCLSFPINTLDIQIQAPNFLKRFDLPKQATTSFRNRNFFQIRAVFYTCTALPILRNKKITKIQTKIVHPTSSPQKNNQPIKTTLLFHSPALVQTRNFLLSAQEISWVVS